MTMGSTPPGTVPVIRPASGAMSSHARTVLRFARRRVLPVLALASMLPGFGAAYNFGMDAPGLAFAGPVELVLWLAAFALVVTFPVLLFAASGVSPRRWWRVAVAVVIAGYGAAVARPVSFQLLAVGDRLANGQVPQGQQAQRAMGRTMMRADPAAAARRAVRGGDTRVFVVDGIVLWPEGVHWTPWTQERIGVKVMPGSVEWNDGGPEARGYERQVTCWVGRYDRELARLLDTPYLTANPAFHRCDPPAAAR
jgi:hypothetical protein